MHGFLYNILTGDIIIVIDSYTCEKYTLCITHKSAYVDGGLFKNICTIKQCDETQLLCDLKLFQNPPVGSTL